MDAGTVDRGPHPAMTEFYERQFAEWLAKSRARLDELEKNPPKSCPMCGHIPYPITATQHCWCDPAEEVMSKQTGT